MKKKKPERIVAENERTNEREKRKEAETKRKDKQNGRCVGLWLKLNRWIIAISNLFIFILLQNILPVSTILNKKNFKQISKEKNDSRIENETFTFLKFSGLVKRNKTVLKCKKIELLKSVNGNWVIPETVKISLNDNENFK